MKQLSVFILALFLLPACKKEAASPTIIIEPPATRLISSDTLTSGQQWGLTIGQSSADLYAKIQEIRVERHITGLGIVGNVFSNLNSLENAIPLYTSVLLDEKPGTGTGIQLNFLDSKVNSIYNNDGVKLTQWPVFSEESKSVSIGDNVNSVYKKLVAIKNINAYVKKFQYISIPFKDVTKAYDPQMDASPQWYFSAPVGDKKYNQVQLNFTGGKLVSIYSRVIESE